MFIKAGKNGLTMQEFITNTLTEFQYVQILTFCDVVQFVLELDSPCLDEGKGCKELQLKNIEVP